MISTVSPARRCCSQTRDTERGGRRDLTIVARFALAALALAVGTCREKSPTTPSPSPPSSFIVFDSTGALASELDVFVNTDSGVTDWLSRTSDSQVAVYPPNQQFGFVAAVLAGDPTFGNRPRRDLSAYRSLVFELRGATGGEMIEVGIKDNTDPDNGTETKVSLTVTQSWRTYSYPLSTFTTADLTRLYLLFELVFNGPTGRTVYFRDVRYVAQ